MNWNCPVSVGGSVRRSESSDKNKENLAAKKTAFGMKVGFVAVALLAMAGVLFHFAIIAKSSKATASSFGVKSPSQSAQVRATVASLSSTPGSTPDWAAAQRSAASASARPVLVSRQALPSKTYSLPLFFEPNQGQTAAPVRFLARGSGYGLFLTADEAVLNLQRPAAKARNAAASSVTMRPPSSVIRMKLEGANTEAAVSGAEPLPGKSTYIIGNDRAKWHHNIPQFGRVEYKGVYPGVDLVYYGEQGQLEYDFRLAPGARPEQIAMSFGGASVRIDSGKSGDLILSTSNGDVRFHAPRVYQRMGSRIGDGETTIAGRFQQLADNRIGFAIADYDHSRELVIDPMLTYSTYLGNSNGIESLVNVAVDPSGLVYLVGSTNSTDFPFPISPPATPPYQSTLGGSGATNVFIAVINPTLTPASTQLVYATYLGGSGTDNVAGVQVSTAVDQGLPTSSIDVYVAGSTTSPDFPTNGVLNPFQPSPIVPGNHGFVSRLNIAQTTELRYSTYLSGSNANDNAADIVTGLAIDNQGNAFVTGTTTSTNGPSNGFPANPNGFQTASNAPNQFFATQLNTRGTGTQSMVYSTYLGGGNPQTGQAVGGGIAVDTSGNMYITGGTNFLSQTGQNGEARFPINLGYQACLDLASQTSCPPGSAPTNLDAFAAKITPKPGFTLPVYCTYLGGSGNEVGYGIAVDSTANAYITGSTTSDDWASTGSGFQTAYGGNQDAFLAKIGNLTGSVYPLNYFTYIGGTGTDVGQAVQVDTLQGAHVVGSTTSTDLLVTNDTVQPNLGGGQDAFVALIVTTASGRGAGDYLTYLGGAGLDQGIGVAVDVFGATYVSGITQSQNFPIPPPPAVPPYQGQLNGTQNAFVSKIGAASTLLLAPAASSPTPNPVAAGTQVAFTFNITNNGPDNASQVFFTAGGLPSTGLSKTPTAMVTNGTGNCSAFQQSSGTISCFIPTLSVCSTLPCVSATVEVDVTPAITTTAQQIQVSGSVIANNTGLTVLCVPSQPPANIVNFSMSASTQTPVINAGDLATITVAFTPTSGFGYNATITPSQSTSPAMTTATSPVFNPTTITLSGSTSASTTLSIQTVARPVSSGALFRRGSLYAAWLPLGGLSLLGLGVGATRRRGRWLTGGLLGLVAGVILLQVACGSSSNSANVTGGTAAGIYNITITGSAGSGASQNTHIQLQVN